MRKLTIRSTWRAAVRAVSSCQETTIRRALTKRSAQVSSNPLGVAKT